MKASDFTEAITDYYDLAATLDLRQGGKALIISDFHMGNGSRGDDLNRNGQLVMDVLKDYYLKDGWNLVLNGDIEDLQRYSYTSIREYWKDIYRIFDAFAEKNRLYKNIGNHDEDLFFLHHYPYPLKEALRIETKVVPVFVYHGHQASRVYTKYNNLVRTALRYFFKPLGIRNISSARRPRKRFHAEKRAYEFSRKNGLVSIIGHTHRPLFESLGRFDYIKYEIEKYCRFYPMAQGEEKEQIAREVRSLQVELRKLKRSERRHSIRESLYGDELPVPCLFNSGSVIGKKGINAIELDGENIALVYWFTQGEGKKFVSRGFYKIQPMAGTQRCKVVLNQDRLDYIKARMDLLS